MFIDYPNLLTLAPFIFAANLTLLKVVDSEDALKFTFKSIGIYSIIGFLPVLVLYVLFSQSLFGRPIAFTNTYNLQRLQIQHIPFNEKHLSNSLFLKQSYSNRFQILRSIRGIEVLLVSRDRGLFFYSPVICASFALNLIIYATFDDPWGGWSFGPRYLVASLPLLTVLVAIYLNSSYKKNLVKFFTFSSILYGFFISLSGVLTTNVLPPSVEAVGLNMSDYYSLSFQYLSNGKISSYLFGEYLHKYMNGYVFYSLISTLFITCLISLLLINNYLAKHEDKFF